MTDEVVPVKNMRTPKSNAQKQRELKERRKHTHSELKTMIHNEVKDDLIFLAKLYGKTQTSIIEELITDARKNCGFNEIK